MMAQPLSPTASGTRHLNPSSTRGSFVESLPSLPSHAALSALATLARATLALASSSAQTMHHNNKNKTHAKINSARLERQNRPRCRGFGRKPSGPTDNADGVPKYWAQKYGTSTSEMGRDARVHCTYSCIFATPRSWCNGGQ